MDTYYHWFTFYVIYIFANILHAKVIVLSSKAQYFVLARQLAELPEFGH